MKNIFSKIVFSFSIIIIFFFLNLSWNKIEIKQASDEDSLYVIENYEKYEYQIPMRDGIKLFTAVYVPNDKSEKFPFLLNRTPYSIGPMVRINSKHCWDHHFLFTKEEYIFVYQDVRGKYMSEGDFVDVRPCIENKISNKDVDESSDTYDTVDWLIHNIPNNNGKVGIYGISYPGFYTVMGIINAHPAVIAASPQAPIADWFWDDFHHNGAFFLMGCF